MKKIFQKIKDLDPEDQADIAATVITLIIVGTIAWLIIRQIGQNSKWW